MGGFFGGRLLSYGRRNTVFISQSLCVLGALISMITHESMLGLGRFILGIGAASFNIAIGKLVLETVPGHLSA